MRFEEFKKQFDALPSFPDSKYVWSSLSKALEIEQKEVVDKYEFAEVVDEALLKLNENYDSATKVQSEKIIRWLSKCWDETDFEFTDLLISIACNTEEELAKVFLESKLFTTTSDEIKNDIKAALKELK